MTSPASAFNPLPCEGLSLLDVPYNEVKLLINANKAKIFPTSMQHAQGADSHRPGAVVWYDSVQGNCLAGLITFKVGKVEIELRATTGFVVQDSEVLRWVRRFLLNKHLQDFELGRLAVQGRVVFG